jgi:hypothetical protein
VDTYEAVHNFVRIVSEGSPVRHFIIHARKCFLHGLNPHQVCELAVEAGGRGSASKQLPTTNGCTLKHDSSGMDTGGQQHGLSGGFFTTQSSL